VPFPPEVLVVAPLIVLGAFVIFGITGFGSTIIAVPLLAHLVPIKFAIPMFVLLDFAAALRHGFKFHDTIATRELLWLVPNMVAGMAAGVLLFLRLPGEAIVGALGVFVLGYGLHMLSGREPTFRLGRAWSVPVGLVGGVISALFGAAGPLFVIYLTARGLDAKQIRSTMSVVFVITTGTRIALFFVSGVFAQEYLFTAAALLAIPMLAGMWLGHHLHVTLPRAQLLRVMGALLALSGGSLVIRALT
jgi:uncharacterized membrane protein YfcA